MAYVSKQQIQDADNITLYEYLMRTCPNEVVPMGGGNYCTKAHDSLVMSNGLWHWFSRGIGGRSALDFLLKTQNMSLPDAVLQICGAAPKVIQWQRREKPKGKIELPLPHTDNRRLKAYLHSRGISTDVMNYCIENNLIYEEKKYHSAVFLGYNADGEVKYGAVRGTAPNSKFKGELRNSDKRFGFAIKPKTPHNILHVFESAIDALSYATILKMSDINWQKYNYLSLGGKAPKALLQFLADNPQVGYIELCLDNDQAGKMAMEKIVETIDSRLVVRPFEPPSGKDYNEYLCEQKGLHNRQLAVAR